MKKTTGVFLLSCAAFATALLGLSAQGSVSALAQEPAPPGEGVDVLLVEPPPAEPELSPAQYTEIQRTIEANVQTLTAAGKLPPPARTAPRLAWPLRPQQGESLNDFGFSAISNFVDHDSAFPNAVRDFACDALTYDTSSGYNHKGTDILLTPFQWRKMDNSEVAVVAAAPGVIVYKRDGEDDRSCGYNGRQWNAVYVRHADGSTAWYGHMKRGSITTKAVGETVATGEVLGLVGSSGNSSTPHLHFELYNAAGNLVDPFAGQCNATTAASWWLDQPPHKDPAVNKLTTGDAAPQVASCPQPGASHARTQFQPGETVYFTGYFRHFAPGMTTAYEILRPDGSTFRSWRYTHSGRHLITAWLYRYYRLADSAPPGQWTFAVTFAGQRYETHFQVGGEEPTATFTPTATATTEDRPQTTVTPTPQTTPRPAATQTPGPFATAPANQPPEETHIYLPSLRWNR